MPSIHVFTNAAKASVNASRAVRELSKSLSLALESPEQGVMVQLSLEQPMLFAGSDEPCAFVQIRNIGNIDPERNPKTVQALTATLTNVIGVPAERVFMNLDDVAAMNWGFRSTTINHLQKK